MTFFGLHLLDWLVILLYLLGMIWIGKVTASSVKNQSDYFLAGRKLGGALQFFLNFGNMTDASGAAKTSSLVYSQGAGGVWLGMQLLFMTPYYWFMNTWFRRSRLTTVADLFIDRFNCRKLATLYAIFNICFNIIFLGGSYLVAYKIGEVLVVKPESAYTQVEARMVAEFGEYKQLKAEYANGTLAASKKERLEYLQRLSDRDELKSYVSYIKPVPVYIIFALVVGIYVILGGMTAAAITDAFQGILIVIFSLILIPFGLWHLGGLEAFHSKLPDRMITLLGAGGSSEFAWYSIGAIIIITIVQQHAVVGNMAIAGSAKDERSASIGAVSGGFTKRLMTIAWCFCGLIAFAMFGNGLSDPDTAWGALSRTLLGPGFLGLMLVGILAADMSTMSSLCLTLSALFVRNIYRVVLPHKSERDGLFVARLLILVALLLGIFVALFLKDILSFAKLCVTLNVAFGATILVLFNWKRVTTTAALVTVATTLAAVLVIPYTVAFIPGLRSQPALLEKTVEIRETHLRAATGEDIAAGRAAQKTDMITAESVIAPKPIYFERILADDPADKNSRLHGDGRFHLELYIVSKIGVPVEKMKPAQLLAINYLFDTALPFILLFSVSLLTRDRDPERTRRFYIKMRTPVLADHERDAAQLAKNLAAPPGADATESIKLFPGSNWELLRWSRGNALAFLTCCGVAIAILLAFGLLLNLGR